MATGFAEAAAAPVAAGLAATGALLFVVAVASAAFFLVGIFAFRSVVAAAFAAAEVLELFAGADLAAFGAGLAAACWVGGTLFFGAGFVATLLRAAAVGAALVAFAISALALPALALVVFFGAVRRALAAVRAFAVAGLFAAGRAVVAFLPVAVLLAGLAALARFTEAAGWVAVRAAALDAAAGLAVRPDDAAADLVVFDAIFSAGALIA